VYSFPLSALAEWSWNVNGRTPRQFAEAWARCAGYLQPVRFADWVEAMTALKKALAQPRVPGAGLPNAKGFKNQFAAIGDSIRDRKPIGLYDDQTLAAATARCQEALALAEPLNRPKALTETRYFAALLTMYRELNRLSEAIVGLDLSQPAAGLKVKDVWTAYQAAVETAVAANAKRVELWRAEPADYVEKAQKEIEGQWQGVRKVMAEAIAALLAKAPAANP
jgi:hypothetical protein